ncbi:MAG TPA: AAA domain-containing protein [Treponema sp.]|nr:AAA domain-containing protein [Treponema sp.]
MTTKILAETLITGISSVIRGKQFELERFVTAYLSGGHVLLEDVPGLGKTTLAKTLSRLVGTTLQNKITPVIFKRIQFTPDLLPYDITGVDIFNPETHCFEFMSGPVFCDILLADEINRTTPKVQSALLEVMAEHQVTSGGITRQVSPLFFVVATQNPVETEGTYPLPIAQLDRFMMRLSLGYPAEDAEISILHDDPAESVLPNLLPQITDLQILASRKEQHTVFCHPALERAIIHLVQKTRKHPAIHLGVSPRGALQLLHAARTLALIRGRTWIEDDDVADLAPPILAHRIIVRDSRTNPSILVSEIASLVLGKMSRTTDWTRDALSKKS